MNLNTPLKAVSGVGPSLAYKLSKLELFTALDLLYHFPFRYDDFSHTITALEAQVGEKVTLQGEIWSIKNVYTRYHKVLTQAVFNDGTSPVNLSWFNQRWLTNQIKVGDRLQISGKVTKYKNKLSIIAPVWEKLPDYTSEVQSSTLHTGKLVAVYPETVGLTSKWFRTKIARILPLVEKELVDPLPEVIRDGMVTLVEAIKKIHQPDTYKQAETARLRLSFDELFYIQLATQRVRMEWQAKPTIRQLKIKNLKLKIKNFTKELPFELTSAQQRVIQEILNDLKKSQPMNRLLQGEVGSGKTVVSAAVAYAVQLNGLKTLFMAPTEILAFQHHQTLSKLLEPHGVKVTIYTGSRKYRSVIARTPSLSRGTKQSQNLKKEIASPEVHRGRSDESPDVIVGTHALLNLNLADVGLVVVDEQQRFGVEQRSLLRSKAKVPHFLTMTATPIPRTVALTLYGDLDLSIIDELPKNRLRVRTYVVPKHKRQDAYGFIRKHVEEGSQVYVITPLIEESETLQSVKAATVEYEHLAEKVFPKLRVGLLHGRLKAKDKEVVINEFKDHKLDILVSTTVVEVGVDVPNATIMVVEGADRFGLAQLHQLRGRVGRGDKQSYCLLFTEDPQATPRLKSLETVYDGLKLAQLDLKIRGSGEIFGTKQSGRWNLKLADLKDISLVEETRNAAEQILTQDPKLDSYPLLKAKLARLAQAVTPD